MIERLMIENIALIPKLNIDFAHGLNILSGETGAGKSIIIDALSFVLGCRADKTLIRYGEEYCFVEVIFDIDNDNAEIFTVLEDLSIERDNTIVISRHFNADGKNKCQINGRTVALTMLKRLTQMLVDIHGQSEHISLLANENQLNLIDKFGNTQSEIDEVGKKLKEYKNIKKQITELGGDKQERERQIDLYSYQIQEIEQAKLYKGEDEEIQSMRDKAINQERITSAITSTLELLYDGESNATSMLKSAEGCLVGVSGFDEEIAKEQARLDSLYYEIKDVVDNLYSITQNYSNGELDIESIDDRYELIKKLKRKYGDSVDGIFEYLEQTKVKLDNLINAENIINELTLQQQGVYEQLLDCCKKLSEKRRISARAFEKSIVSQLNDLSLKNARFEVCFSDCDEHNVSNINANGYDNVEFMFSANAGQPLKPLNKIISGGELSRFMLAIKNIISDIDNIPTLIFDEIDTGISGNVATVVAEKFAEITRNHQVIAITHLPQICAMADSNLLIQKNTQNNVTTTTVTTLNEQDALREIGRLAGGIATSENTLKHAKELKQYSDKYKEEHRKC